MLKRIVDEVRLWWLSIKLRRELDRLQALKRENAELKAEVERLVEQTRQDHGEKLPEDC